MKRWLNHKITLILLYSTATLVCVATILYFIKSYVEMRDTEKQLNTAQDIFEETNDLAVSLNMAQSFGEQYVTNRNTDFLRHYRAVVDSSFSRIDTLFSELSNVQQNQLLALFELFEQKEILLQKISERQPVFDYANVFKEEIDSVYENDFQYHTEPIIEIDTTTVTESRGFFRRLGQLFSSTPKPTQIITIRQSDSIVHERAVHVPSPTKTIDTLLHALEQNQEKQLKTLEKRYIALISADRKISQDISTILIQLHETALGRVVEMLSQKDHSSKQVLFAGILAFLVISGFVFVIFISAQNSLRRSRKLSEAKRITEELMQSRHQLLLSISHDIKAPLCSILSYLEFWDKDNLSVEEIRQLSSMQNSATHILDMLSNLLEFSRLEQKKTQIQNQTIEPIPLFLEIVDLFKPMTAGKDLKFRYQFNHLEDCRIMIDALKLRQITTNLVSNAVKYTTQGEIQLHVELLNEPARLKIVVSDTGIGIPKDKLDHIFDSFTQLENRSANVEGSGFGLFVVKGLTEVMNGTISVHSSEKGTTFDVELPVLQL